MASQDPNRSSSRNYVRDARGRFKSSTANTTPKDKGRLWGAWPGGSTIYDIYFTHLVSCLDSYWDKIKYFLAQPSHHQGRGSWLLSDGLMGRGKGKGGSWEKWVKRWQLNLKNLEKYWEYSFRLNWFFGTPCSV